jgi:hypothetical protein
VKTEDAVASEAPLAESAEGMKKSRITEQQIAYALRLVE